MRATIVDRQRLAALVLSEILQQSGATTIVEKLERTTLALNRSHVEDRADRRVMRLSRKNNRRVSISVNAHT